MLRKEVIVPVFSADYGARGHVTTAASAVRCGERGRQECR